MVLGLSFFFSAKFLTHRQANRQADPVQDCEPYLNFSRYWNRKLFRHSWCSFQRNIMEKEERGNEKQTQEEKEQQ